MTRRVAVAVAVGLTLAVALTPAGTPAQAQKAEPPSATINICDTAKAPDALGVRAGMPGNGTRQLMFVRFQAQYKKPDGGWADTKGSGRSPWLLAGSASFLRRSVGWTFRFSPPPAGQAFVLRARADFEWRERRKTRKGRGARFRVVKRARRITRGGFEGVDGGDPPGYSAAICELEP